MKQLDGSDAVAQRKLHGELACLAVAGVLFLFGLFLALQQSGMARLAWAWLAVSALLSAYPFWHLWRHLHLNRLDAGSPLIPSLGPANVMTLSRSVLNACLAGFLVAPRPEDWAAWVPGLLYLVSVILDYLDGYVARITGRSTLLGEVLDMHWDSTGALIGSILAVRYGQAPLPYILMGLARYLYVFGLWLRRRLGLPVNDIALNPAGRPIAGMEMGFLAVILLPIFTPPATQVAALLFLLPLVISFLRDWIAQTRRVPAASAALHLVHTRKVNWRAVHAAVPLAARVLVVGLLAWILIDPHGLAGSPYKLVLVAAAAIPALLLGAAGRVAALLVLLISGLLLQAAPLDARFWMVLLFSTLLMMLGTGKFSLWKPEEWLIHRRAGERPH